MSKDVFERRLSTGTETIRILGPWFCPNFKAGLLFKSKTLSNTNLVA